mmetsp:Transcript_7489/g.6815  ORF Transcript_7489/g.6815 Transcript_7489/m.6815 type:complete len:81 (+) Transcript_7489:899-1141(+)
MNLDEAAKRVGFSKKTLDDYFMIIKRARALNFDFCANQNQRFGILRSFVKKNKNSIKNNNTAVTADAVIKSSKKINKINF